jgi:hypothetical protein
MTKPLPSSHELANDAAIKLAEAESQLVILAGQTDAAAAFASYALLRLSGMQKDGIEKHSRPGPAAVEYAAWLLFPHFGKSAVRDSDSIQKMIDTIESCNSALAFTEIFFVTDEDEKDDALSVHVRLQSGMVRGSAYPQQLKRRLAGVLEPFEPEFASLIGIGPRRAFEVATAIARQVEENINAMKTAFRETKARGDALYARPNLTAEDKVTLTAIGAELQKIVGGMEGDWAAHFDEVANRLVGLQRAEWDALRRIIGLTAANRPLVDRLVDVQDRPIYFLSDERALIVHMTEVFDAIFTYFDDIARSTLALANRYGHRVAEWMEEEIERLLWCIFPKHTVYRSACFPDPDNVGGETEADAVIIWGPFLVVAEAKGKRIARDAMRGSKTKLKQTIQNNIQDAFYQARRVVRILERDGKITFKEKSTGRTVEIEKERLNRVMPISITLQHLSGIPTQLALTQQLGLFKGKAYPWSVSIDDLEIITRFVGSPDAFLHYIERRTAHQSSDISFNGDELDIFGHYLDNRLHPSVYESNAELAGHNGPKSIAFSGGEERFEKVYFAEWEGEACDASNLKLSLPPDIEPILHELRDREDDGARWIAFALLGFSHTALLRLAGAVKDLRAATYDGRRIQRLTTREGDIVMNVMAHAGLDEKSFHENTVMRTRLEHYRSKPRATFTLGIDQRNRFQSFATATWVEGPWAKEEIMEQLLTKDRETPRKMQLLRHGKKPGRNDPCPCSSGRKFKRCCIEKLTFERRT